MHFINISMLFQCVLFLGRVHSGSSQEIQVDLVVNFEIYSLMFLPLFPEVLHKKCCTGPENSERITASSACIGIFWWKECQNWRVGLTENGSDNNNGWRRIGSVQIYKEVANKKLRNRHHECNCKITCFHTNNKNWWMTHVFHANGLSARTHGLVCHTMALEINDPESDDVKNTSSPIAILMWHQTTQSWTIQKPDKQTTFPKTAIF